MNKVLPSCSADAGEQSGWGSSQSNSPQMLLLQEFCPFSAIWKKNYIQYLLH